MGRAPCCDKANVKKGPWSPEEDAKLKAYIQDHGTGGNWITLPQKIGLKRCGKSCRLRWLNYLRPNIKHGGFSEEEDYIISTLFLSIGSRWSIIAARLPGRTDNDIKNYWNTKLKKKFMRKQCKAGQSTGRKIVIKKDSNTIEKNLMASGKMMNPSPCYPELPMHVPALDPNSYDHINDRDSITKFLISSGGKFYHDHQQPDVNSTTTTTVSVAAAAAAANLECPFEYLSPYQDLVYDNFTNSLNEDCSQFPYMYQGFNYRTQEQLESRFGVDIVNCRSGNSYVESSNWVDINSMAYDPIPRVEDYVFQESSCFGVQ